MFEGNRLFDTFNKMIERCPDYRLKIISIRAPEEQRTGGIPSNVPDDMQLQNMCFAFYSCNKKY